MRGSEMKKHNGMKSQDILILLYISEYCDGDFKVSDLAKSLNLSQSEISESLNRSRIAKLISQDKLIFRSALFEFLRYGFKYVFPVQPGPIQRGFPTSHSHTPLSNDIVGGNESYVWPSPKGTTRGMAIEPIYRSVTQFCSETPELWELLSLLDALRIGRAREVNLASKYLEKRILNNGQ